jgi:phage terminase large subunit-like protein
MSSTSAALSRSRPRVRLAPRSVSSDADDAAFLSSGYGLTPDDWQEDVLDDWLGRRRDGRWSAATCGLAVPRQNGKNGIIEIRELFGMVALGEKFLHTAHEVKTARKAFIRIAGFFENVRQYPELAALVKDIRKTNGQEAVLLTNGGAVEFIARSRGSGRGFTVDVLVCDEAQDLTDEELAALLPTISAAPLGNPQVVLTGTPPDPEKGQQGEVFNRVRADAEANRDKRLAWTDYGATDGPLPDVDDRQAWAEHNPALGLRLAEAEIVRERTLMSPETFARERLGWWGDPSAASSTAFGEGRWQACLGKDDLEPVHDAVAAAVAFDRMHASIGAAGQLGDLLAVGAVERRDGTGWLVPELARIQSTYGCPVVVDGGGPTADLIPAMEAAGISLEIIDTGKLKDACANIFDAVQEKRLVHPGHPDLDLAVSSASKRDVGDRWAWARKQSTGDISMLEAVTLALWAATNTAPTVW